MSSLKYFGSSGIRGVVGDFLTSGFIMKAGYAVGSLHDKLIVGHDMRVSSPSLARAFISGALSAGAEVDFAGYVSTPTLAYATRNYDAGVMITASHNPPEYNGIKLWNPDGMGFSVEQMLAVERSIDSQPTRVSWDMVKPVNDVEVISEHRDAILDSAGGASFDRVVIDFGNGMASTMSSLFSDMALSFITLNANMDGMFPGRPSEPNEKNLSDLITLTKKHGLFGLAFDGDSDRFLIVSPDGKFHNGDHVMALFIKKFGFRKVVVPVDSSMLIDSLTNQVKRTRVGDVYVGLALKESGYDFGGEQSGTQLFPKWRYTPDAIYSAALFLSKFTPEEAMEILNSLPSYITLRENVRYSPDEKEKLMNRLENAYGDTADRTDGFRIVYDNAWSLVRFSGTEPLVRITVEGENDETVRKILAELREVLS